MITPPHILIKERVGFAAGIYALFFISYGLANRSIRLSDCRDLSLPLDAAIPFIPEFVYPFYLVYVLIILPAFLLRDRTLFVRAAKAFVALILTSTGLFFLFPVIVPRPEFIPETVAGSLVAAVYSHDRPVCGFPSLHVSTAILAATVMIREHWLTGGFYMIVALLTAISTLFIKQHGIIDVSGGILMALCIDQLMLRNGLSPLVRVLRAAALMARSASHVPTESTCSNIRESTRTTGQGNVYDLYEPLSHTCRTYLLIPGLTLQGQHDARLLNFARSLARSGVRAATACLPGLKDLRFELNDIAVIKDISAALQAEFQGNLGIIGFSIGGGYALVAASDMGPLTHIGLDPLIVFAPHYDMAEVWDTLNIKSKEMPRSDDEEAWDTFLWLRLLIAYRAKESLSFSEDEMLQITSMLESYCAGSTLASKQAFYKQVLHKSMKGVTDRQTPPPDVMHTLSPRGKMESVSARVYILHDKYDPIVSPEQSRQLFAELCRRGENHTQKLLVTPLLAHVTAGSAWKIRDIFRLLGIFSEIFR